MKLRRRLLCCMGAAMAIALPVLASPIAARADSPPGPYSVTPQQPATYSNSTGVVGWPDPNGPPAPGCPTVSCDQQTVTFGAGTSPTNDVFGLTLTVSYTSTDTTLGNCLDIAIEDSTASVVLAKQNCAPSGGSITDPNVAPGTAYVMEIDADAANGAAVMAQPFSATVSASATASSGGGGPTPTPTPINPFSFTHQVSVDIQHGDGEPDLAIDPGNSQTMLTATPWGFSTTVSLLWKSSDGGVQWDNLHGSAVGEACPDPAALVLRPDCSRGGGDAEVQFSQPAGSGNPSRIQFEDLNGLDSISCAYSDNGGDTFTDLTSNTPPAGAACNEGTTANANNCAQQTTNPSSGCATLGTDRQWLQVWPKADQPSGATSDKLYMIFDTGDQPPSGDAAISSPDNGVTWSLDCSTTSGSSCVGGSKGVGSRPGPLVINPTLLQVVNNVTYPTLYEFMGTSSNGSEVNISCDGGQTWSNVATSNGLAGSTTNDFVAGAIDGNGELYTAFSVANDPNPWRVYFNHSVPAKASTIGNCSQPVQDSWANPVALTGPPSTADGVGATNIPSQNYAVMPWLTAGAGGRVDLVYYGTTQATPFSPDNAAANWYLHMAQTLDGGSTWTDEQATETPMHLQSICFSGIGCTAQSPPGGDRNLLDFFQVKLDPSGRAIIIYTDDANSAACAPTCTQGIGLISEVQQATGPSLLTGAVPTLPSTGLGQSLDVRQAGVNAEITKPSGEAIAPSIGHNVSGTEVPAADITDLKVCLTNSTVCPVANTASNTVSFLFTLQNLAGGPQTAVQTTDGMTNANWLVTWRGGSPNDLWFAQASTDATGNMTCIYGRPTSVYNDGEPKAAEYISDPKSVLTGTAACSVNATTSPVNGQAPNTIEINVPMNSVSGLGASELFGLTGWTGNSSAALASSVCSADGINPTTDTCSGSVGFFTNIAETAPMDVTLGPSTTNTPEVPAVPLLVGFGIVAILGGGAVRRRRHGRSAAV